MWEFLFCPVHGIFGAANWPMLAPACAGAAALLRRYFSKGA
jgi:hypothetical protein